MRESGWTQIEAAKKLHISQSLVSQYSNERGKVSERTLELFQRLLDDREDKSNPAVIVHQLVPKGLAGTSMMAPIIAWASAGDARQYEDQGPNSPKVAVVCKDPNCYVLELEGNSMEPIYLPGDLIVCAPNMEAHNGDLVMAKTTEDEVYFKRYHVGKHGEVRLSSFNPHYPVMEFKRGQVRKIHVVQSVIRVLKGKVT